jgi:hypothetical protein
VRFLKKNDLTYSILFIKSFEVSLGHSNKGHFSDARTGCQKNSAAMFSACGVFPGSKCPDDFTATG